MIGNTWCRHLAVGLLFIISPVSVQAHEGHDHSVPGAIPSPLHGGRVAEAKGSQTTPSGELFIEAVYKNKRLSVYPLLLEPTNTKVFKPLAPQALSSIELSVKNPRSGKVDKLTPKATEKAFEADYELKGANRAILHVSLSHENVVKATEIQIERR